MLEDEEAEDANGGEARRGSAGVPGTSLSTTSKISPSAEVEQEYWNTCSTKGLRFWYGILPRSQSDREQKDVATNLKGHHDFFCACQGWHPQR